MYVRNQNLIISMSNILFQTCRHFISPCTSYPFGYSRFRKIPTQRNVQFLSQKTIVRHPAGNATQSRHPRIEVLKTPLPIISWIDHSPSLPSSSSTCHGVEQRPDPCGSLPLITGRSYLNTMYKWLNIQYSYWMKKWHLTTKWDG